MMLQTNPQQAVASDIEASYPGAKETLMGQRHSQSAAQHDRVRQEAAGDGRSVRDHWLHDFRNALGNTTIAASAVRFEVNEGRSEQVVALMRQIEEGCDRCMRLLASMPR